MNIGQAASQAGVSAKMIRHYESIELLPAAERTPAGYRIYTDNDVHVLRFIKQSRQLGFSIEQIRELLDLWKNQRRTSSKVKALAQNHINSLEQRIHELQEIKNTLSHLIHCCQGNERPECPILEGLAK